MRSFASRLLLVTTVIWAVLASAEQASALTTTDTIGVCSNFPSNISTPSTSGSNVVQFGTDLVAGDIVSFSGTITLDAQANNGVVAQVTGASGSTVFFDTGGSSNAGIESFASSFTATTAGNHIFEVTTGGEVSQIDASVSCVPVPIIPTDTTGTPLTTTEVMVQTSQVIERIIKIRIPGMVSDEPDLVSRLRIGRGKKSGMVSVSGFAHGNRSNVRMSTGIAQIQNNLEKTVASYSPTTDTDFWIEGRFSHSTTSLQNNALAILYASFDHLIHEDLLVGVMGQLDWSNDWSRISNASAKSLGWMAGPYFVYRPFDDIYLDARVAYGTSNGDLKPFGTYTDEYHTQRWLARAQLTGDLDFSEFRVSPMAQIVYFSEAQGAYTDALGNRIVEQDISLGRFTAGVELARTWTFESGAMFAPQIALKAVWDFAGDNATRIQGLASFLEEFHGRFEAGFRYTANSGLQLSLEGFYDGIGNNDFSMIGGRVRLVIPLNY